MVSKTLGGYVDFKLDEGTPCKMLPIVVVSVPDPLFTATVLRTV